jgi:hypothetical protein
MESGHADSPASSLSARVLRSALLVGALAFTAGFVAPLILSRSNLGPLLGIFVAGPVGALAGALWGLMRAATHSNPAPTSAILTWLAAIWGVTLLYTLFLLGLSPQAAVLGIGLQALIVMATAFLLYGAGPRAEASEPLHRRGPVVLGTLGLILLTTAFPPVTDPWWGPQAARERADAVPVPKRAFVLDSRFDASRHVPLLAVDRRMLLLEWVIASGVALVLSQLFVRRHGQPGAEV